MTRAPVAPARKARPPRPPAPAPDEPPPDAADADVVLVTDEMLAEATRAEPGVVDLHDRRISSLTAGALSNAVAAGVVADAHTLDVSFNALRTLAGVDAMRGLETLRAYDNALATCDGLRALATTLRTLTLQNNALRSLDGVETLRNLRSLRVDGNPLGNVGVRAATRLASLTALDVSRCGLTRLDGFTSLVNLTELNVSGNDALASIEQLCLCVKLTDLDVGECALTDASLAHLRPLRRLDALSLEGNAALTSLAKMPRLENLTELNAARLPALTSWSGVDFARIAPSLETLDLEACGFRALRDLLGSGASALSALPALTELRCRGIPCARPADDAGADGADVALSLRREIVSALPSVLYVDDVAVGAAERGPEMTAEETEALRRRAALASKYGGGDAEAEAEGRPVTPADFGFYGVGGGVSVTLGEEDDDDLELELDLVRRKKCASSASAVFRPRSARILGERKLMDAGAYEDVAADFTRQMRAFGEEMKGIIGRIRNGLKETRQDAAAAMRADGVFEDALDDPSVAPSTRLPPAPRMKAVSSATRPAGERRVRLENDAAVRAKKRAAAAGSGASASESIAIAGDGGDASSSSSSRPPKTPPTRGATPSLERVLSDARTRTRAALERYERAFPSSRPGSAAVQITVDADGDRSPEVKDRVAAAMAAAEAAAADSDDDCGGGGGGGIIAFFDGGDRLSVADVDAPAPPPVCEPEPEPEPERAFEDDDRAVALSSSSRAPSSASAAAARRTATATATAARGRVPAGGLVRGRGGGARPLLQSAGVVPRAKTFRTPSRPGALVAAGTKDVRDEADGADRRSPSARKY